jgi:hypothetical protein
MVSSLSNASDANLTKQKNSRVVEIIGPAGAGKTTLFRQLGRYPEKIRQMTFPDVRKATDAPFFIKYGLQLIPSLFQLNHRNSRQLRRREFAWMSILKGWPYILQKEVRKNTQLILLDQGPVYLLAEMRGFGPEYLRSEDASRFWEKIYCRWAETLDSIVWLDAGDIYLLERIQARPKEHVVKHEPAPVVYDFLARYRNAYDYVISRIKTCPNGPSILRFDTSKQRPGEIVDHLLSELGLS